MQTVFFTLTFWRTKATSGLAKKWFAGNALRLIFGVVSPCPVIAREMSLKTVQSKSAFYEGNQKSKTVSMYKQEQVRFVLERVCLKMANVNSIDRKEKQFSTFWHLLFS